MSSSTISRSSHRSLSNVNLEEIENVLGQIDDLSESSIEEDVPKERGRDLLEIWGVDLHYVTDNVIGMAAPTTQRRDGENGIMQLSDSDHGDDQEETSGIQDSSGSEEKKGGVDDISLDGRQEEEVIVEVDTSICENNEGSFPFRENKSNVDSGDEGDEDLQHSKSPIGNNIFGTDIDVGGVEMCDQSETLDDNDSSLHRRDDCIPKSHPQSPSSKSSKTTSSEQSKNQIANDTYPNKSVPAQVSKGNNSPEQISTFLHHRHRDHYLLFNISSSDPTSETKYMLDNQIVNLQWSCPGINSSESTDTDGYQLPRCPTAASIPTLRCLLTICYAIDAYLKLHPKNRAVVYCSNGKTRTGIAIAAYLKYSSRVASALDGFRLFCSQTVHNLVSAGEVDDLIPPSLKTLFSNFDSLIECGGAIQKKQLILRAVTLQGLPVDDMPRVDIWDESGLVYSSHLLETPISLNVDDDIDTSTCSRAKIDSGAEDVTKKKLVWADEEGFYVSFIWCIRRIILSKIDVVKSHIFISDE